MVPHNTVIVPTAQLEKNVIKVATKQHEDKQLYKRENIKQTDVIEGGRSARAGRGKNTHNKHRDQKLEENKIRNTRTKWKPKQMNTDLLIESWWCWLMFYLFISWRCFINYSKWKVKVKKKKGQSKKWQSIAIVEQNNTALVSMFDYDT